MAVTTYEKQDGLFGDDVSDAQNFVETVLIESEHDLQDDYKIITGPEGDLILAELMDNGYGGKTVLKSYYVKVVVEEITGE